MMGLAASPKVQTVRATIGGIGPALDPLILLHTVERAYQRHGIGFCEFRQPRLAYALVAREVR